MTIPHLGRGDVMKNIIQTELIDEFLVTNKISVDEFCQNAKISKSDLKKIYNKNLDFDIEVLFKIAKIMKTDICKIFENPN